MLDGTVAPLGDYEQFTWKASVRKGRLAMEGGGLTIRRLRVQGKHIQTRSLDSARSRVFNEKGP